MKKITLLTLLALVTFSCSNEQEEKIQMKEIQQQKEDNAFKKKREELLKGVELSEEELQAEKEFGF